MSKILVGQQTTHNYKLTDLMVTDPIEREKLIKMTIELPRLNLTKRQLCDLELLMNGGFSPLTGFMNEDDYKSVVNNLHLQNGLLWPIPIVLDVSDITKFKPNSKVLLCDEYGKPLAIFTISSIYKPDKHLEAQKVYGTTNVEHFGVRFLLNHTGNYYLGGKVIGLNRIDHYDFIEYRYSPLQLRTIFRERKWKKIIGFQTRNPIHRAHFTLIKRAAEKYEANILLHPSVGMTKNEDFDYILRSKCYISLYENYIKDFAFLNLLPLAMRMAGPREAVLHAIIRKNYGCTHFIIGRDHAGPGSDSKGVPFYQPYDAQGMVNKYALEIGIIPILFNEMVYVDEIKSYIPSDEVTKKHTVKKISGTEFKKMIMNDLDIPEWFSFPEIIKEIKHSVERQRKDGLTIFFTGLPSSGKSTIAQMLYYRLLEIQNKNVTLLDGDIIRQNLSKGLGFSKEDRDTNIARIGFVANEVVKHRGIAICAAIAPYEEARQINRALISENGNYIEVYISTPADICAERDVKGLYKIANNNKLKGFTGVDDFYESPSKPEITINTEGKLPEICVNEIVNYLTDKDLIQITI